MLLWKPENLIMLPYRWRSPVAMVASADYPEGDAKKGRRMERVVPSGCSIILISGYQRSNRPGGIPPPWIMDDWRQ